MPWHRTQLERGSDNIPAIKFHGGCACASVRYSLSSAPMYIHCCHCSWCQRETGSAFALNALIETSNVHLQCGTIEQVGTPTLIRGGQLISRCRLCKVAVWSNYGAANKNVRFVCVGTLDDAQQFKPDIRIFTASKQAWLVLDESTPSVLEYYRGSQYWSAESVQRYKRATAR